MNRKELEVNAYLKELSEEKDTYSVNNNKKIRLQHLNIEILYLNKKGSTA